MKNIIVIIQARMGSSRLPGKVLMPLYNKPVLQYVVERSQKILGVDEVIVATSTLIGDDPIEVWCRENGITCFRGSEEDVLSRYYECASQFQPQYVIRVTADCPYVDYDMGSGIVQQMMNHPSDIVKVEGDLPRGLVIEMLSYRALSYIYEHGHEHRHREHVTYYAYEYPEQFTATIYKAKEEICKPEFRITLDTPEDYQLCQAVSEHYLGDVEVSSAQVVQYLRVNPKIARLNSHIEQKPVV